TAHVAPSVFLWEVMPWNAPVASTTSSGARTAASRDRPSTAIKPFEKCRQSDAVDWVPVHAAATSTTIHSKAARTADVSGIVDHAIDAMASNTRAASGTGIARRRALVEE